MRTREVLAVAGIAAVAGGSLEAAHEFDIDATAQALFITTKTCAMVYDAPSGTEGRSGDRGSSSNLTDVSADGTSAQLAAFTVGDPSNPWVVTRQTLKCLKAGAWIQGGAAVDTSNIKVGEPERLLRGYAELEEQRGENFNPSSALIGAFICAGLGGFIAASYRRSKQSS